MAHLRSFMLPATAAMLVAAASASAAQPPAAQSPAAQPPAAQSPGAPASAFLGEWELDLTRMPDSYGPSPKRVVYSFADIGDGQWRTTIDITAPDGSVRHIAMRYRRDGKAVPGEGDRVDGDTAALGSPAPNVLVMTVGQNKALGSVRVYAVSADGREMTESAANVDNDGAPFVRNFHYKRIR